MNIHALRLFYTVAEKGSVTQAAKELNISQPAVTAQIKKLEQEINLVLMAPKGRGVLLTQSGLQLAKQARRLFSLESEIEDTIKQLKRGVFGRLCIVATYLPANFLLPKWIASYKRIYPNVEVELTTTNSSSAINQLVNFKADIAFIGGRRESNSLIDSSLLFEDEMLFIVHKNHKFASKRIKLADIAKEPFVFREEGSYSREKLDSLWRFNNVCSPTIGVQMNGLNETIRTVIEGYGVTFASFLEVSEYLERGDIAKVEVSDFGLKNPISLYTRKEEVLTETALNFLQTIDKYIN